LVVTATFGPPRLLRRPGGAREFEREALQAAEEGRMAPEVQTLALAEAVRAHEWLESRTTIGKLVLTPSRSMG
jgi:NADPH:quinone reductase-like Zn-dependent oxidoreductase